MGYNSWSIPNNVVALNFDDDLLMYIHIYVTAHTEAKLCP